MRQNKTHESQDWNDNEHCKVRKLRTAPGQFQQNDEVPKSRRKLEQPKAKVGTKQAQNKQK